MDIFDALQYLQKESKMTNTPNNKQKNKNNSPKQ